MNHQLDTHWVEVFNTIGQHEMREFGLDPDRFKFKGIHRGKAIFEFVLIHRDYDVDLFEELRQYVEVYRTHINQLSTLKTAKVSIKRRHEDFYYKCNQYHVWYYFIHFEKAVKRPNIDLKPSVADLDRYWIVKYCNYRFSVKETDIHITGFEVNLGILQLTGVVHKNRIKRAGGINEMANTSYGEIVKAISDYCDVKYLEYRIREESSTTEYLFAGCVREELFLVEQYEIDL